MRRAKRGEIIRREKAMQDGIKDNLGVHENRAQSAENEGGGGVGQRRDRQSGGGGRR